MLTSSDKAEVLVKARTTKRVKKLPLSQNTGFPSSSFSPKDWALVKVIEVDSALMFSLATCVKLDIISSLYLAVKPVYFLHISL